MNQPQYDYHKVFFRRPWWNDSNRLFFTILLITNIFLLSTNSYFIHYFENLPEILYQKEIKETFISRILIYYNNNESASKTIAGWEEPAPETIALEPDLENIVQKKVQTLDVDRFSIPEISTPALPSDEDINPMVLNIIRSKILDQKQIADAIENTPGLILPSDPVDFSHIATVRMRRQKYFDTIEELNKNQPKAVNIPPPEMPDFEILKGVRDDQETIAILNGHKKLIKVCIDKFYFNDPTVKGDIVVKFSIHPDGYVIPESIRVVHSDIQDPRVIECIKKNIRRWRNFPKVALDMGEYTITQKYIF